MDVRLFPTGDRTPTERAALRSANERAARPLFELDAPADELDPAAAFIAATDLFTCD